MAREVLPHVPDAWVDYDKTKVGYEIPINRHFYVYKPPRPLDAYSGRSRPPISGMKSASDSGLISAIPI